MMKNDKIPINSSHTTGLFTRCFIQLTICACVLNAEINTDWGYFLCSWTYIFCSCLFLFCFICLFSSYYLSSSILKWAYMYNKMKWMNGMNELWSFHDLMNDEQDLLKWSSCTLSLQSYNLYADLPTADISKKYIKELTCNTSPCVMSISHLGFSPWAQNCMPTSIATQIIQHLSVGLYLYTAFHQHFVMLSLRLLCIQLTAWAWIWSHTNMCSAEIRCSANIEQALILCDVTT